MADTYNAPVYAKIALDLAGKIASGELNEGQRLSGRSLLAGTYRVSPETIRRSIRLLEDMEIVQTKAGSGITVISRPLAMRYVERYRVMTGIRAIREEIRLLVHEKATIEIKIGELIERIEEQANLLQNVRPIYPYEIVVQAGSPLLGKTISDAKFWQNTGATIVAIQRGGLIINSPGPYAVFVQNDVLFVTGDPGVDYRVANYLKEG